MEFHLARIVSGLVVVGLAVGLQAFGREQETLKFGKIKEKSTHDGNSFIL